MKARPARAAAIAALLVAACGCSEGGASLPCTFTVQDDGSQGISCPDGSSVAFPPRSVSSRNGSVSGRVSRFGEPDRSGIDVWLTLAPATLDEPRESFHAVTGAEGAFRFDDVPPGVHEVGFVSAGFTREARQAVVDPGEFVLDPVVLRRGFEALACEQTALFLSPRRDAFLARYGDRSTEQRLVYWEPGGAGMVPLGQRVWSARGSDYFSADGRLVHFLEEPDGGNAGPVLYRYEAGHAVPRPIAGDVDRWYPALGGDALVLETRTGLKAWSERFAGNDGSSALRAISAEVPGMLFPGPDGRLVSFVVGGYLVVWDMREMTGERLGLFRESPVYSPDGSVLMASFGSRLVAWDADADGSRGVIGLGAGDAGGVSFHESGRRFVYLEIDGSSQRLVHVDLDHGAMPVMLRERVEEAFYGRGDGGIAWIEEVSGKRELYRAAAPDERPVSVGRADQISGVTSSSDGKRLYFVTHDADEETSRLQIHESPLDTHDVASIVGAPILEPGGDGVFFYEPVPPVDGDPLPTLGLRYWDPVTDDVLHIHDPVLRLDGGFETLAGPGSRLLFAGADGTWHRWDPAAGATAPLGPSDYPPDYRFLADGAVAFADSSGLLRLLEPEGATPRIVGTGVAVNGLYGPSGDGLRFSYRYGRTSPTLVLFDRAGGRAIPLDDEVTTAVQGDTFVAYVRDVPTEEGSQRLFLVAYPGEER